MTSTHRSPADPAASSAPSSAPSIAPASAAADRSLLADIMAVTPSATLSRELLALVLNLALAGLVVLVVQPSPLASAVVLGAVALFMLVRLGAGIRLHGYGRTSKGGR